MNIFSNPEILTRKVKQAGSHATVNQPEWIREERGGNMGRRPTEERPHGRSPEGMAGLG